MELRFECERTWEDLDGDDDVRRHCSECDHPVYNLSGMTRRQARRLFDEHGDDIPCVRFVSRAGRIVHNGDPLEQLRRQRHGARKLLAGAVAIHAIVFALSDDPGAYWYDPFGASTAVLEVDSHPRELTGVPAPLASDRIDVDCDGRDECLAQARGPYERAAAHANQTEPGSRYLEFAELDAAQKYLTEGYVAPPESMADLDDRRLALEEELDELAMTYRIRHHQLAQRKLYGEMATNIREWREHFPDDRYAWGREAIDAEFTMKDRGTWPKDLP